MLNFAVTELLPADKSRVSLREEKSVKFMEDANQGIKPDHEGNKASA